MLPPLASSAATAVAFVSVSIPLNAFRFAVTYALDSADSALNWLAVATTDATLTLAVSVASASDTTNVPLLLSVCVPPAPSTGSVKLDAAVPLITGASFVPLSVTLTVVAVCADVLSVAVTT